MRGLFCFKHFVVCVCLCYDEKKEVLVMWFDESVIYQIYPFAFVGAPEFNDGKTENRMQKFIDYIPHLKKLNVNAVYFCPIFESSRHGYDTKDFSKIDCRLGTNENFKTLCEEYHKNGIKVILDGVFNHVGREFFAFEDVKKNKANSRYKDWFHINFDGNSNYDDGFYYEGWVGHYELVKLNLNNPEVKKYIFECVKMWIEEFDIDGLRLDVAYLLEKEFLKELRRFVDSLKPEFFMLGEMVHGEYYKQIMNDEMLHSVTNYECFKGIYSSFNDMNMYEISYSLNRQFGSDGWCLYTGKNLLSFVDNHDVSRIASLITNPNHLKLAFGLLFTMPGIPCIYYGSEWGAEGVKVEGTDESLRPKVDKPVFNELSEFISKLCKIRTENKILAYGSFANLVITNPQYVFERRLNDKRIVVAINAAENNFTAQLNLSGEGTELLTNQKMQLSNELLMPAYSIQIIEI